MNSNGSYQAERKLCRSCARIRVPQLRSNQDRAQGALNEAIYEGYLMNKGISDRAKVPIWGVPAHGD